jgi:hypothetical protein
MMKHNRGFGLSVTVVGLTVIVAILAISSMPSSRTSTNATSSPAISSSKTSTAMANTTTSYTPSTSYVTGTSIDSANDTFMNGSCVDAGAGMVELRVVSNSTGVPVTGESVNAVNDLNCGYGNQLLYLNNFTVSQGGWLMPILPNQAQAFGWLNFTVSYQGATYQIPTRFGPFEVVCVTLRVPTGNVTEIGISPSVPGYPGTPRPTCPAG